MYKDKKVLVCGMAKSGLSAALLLKKLGASVTLQDIKTDPPYMEEAEAAGIPLYLGENPDEIIENFELVIVSPGIPCDLPFFKIAESLNIPLIGEVEFAFSLSKCGIAAVTGTNGKTTTTALLGEILNAAYPGSEAVGNIGVPFSERALEIPESAYAAAEISSFMLETVKTFKPKIAVMLNITPDHLNRHHTLEDYAAVKEKIFMNQNEGDFSVINYDDPICREMLGRVKSKAVPFSRVNQLDSGVYVKNGKIYGSVFGSEEELLSLTDIKMPGNHSIENVLAAAAAAYCAKVPVSIIKSVVSGFKGGEHRIELVRELDGVLYYNDSKATNTDSAIKALDTLLQPVILIGGGKDKDADFSDWVGRFSGHVKHLVIIGETGERIRQTCDKLNFTNYSMAKTLKEAVSICFNTAQNGDCVLLSPACASLDMFDSYEHRGNLFKEYVREL